MHTTITRTYSANPATKTYLIDRIFNVAMVAGFAIIGAACIIVVAASLTWGF